MNKSSEVQKNEKEMPQENYRVCGRGWLYLYPPLLFVFMRGMKDQTLTQQSENIFFVDVYALT